MVVASSTDPASTVDYTDRVGTWDISEATKQRQFRSRRMISVNRNVDRLWVYHMKKMLLGKRRERRYQNDWHIVDGVPSCQMEEIMEHATLSMSYRSNLELLLAPENKHECDLFRESSEQLKQSSPSRTSRSDEWTNAEEQFMNMEKQTRYVLAKSYKAFSDFIRAVEDVLVHYISWGEMPSEIEQSRALKRLLMEPIHIGVSGELRMPLMKSSFHRLLVHAICQFYALESKSEFLKNGASKVVVIKAKSEKCHVYAEQSICDYIFFTKVVAPVKTRMFWGKDPSECSSHSGYELVDLEDF